MIEHVNFSPVKGDKGLIGFCGFRFNVDFSFNNIAVFKLLKPKGRIKVRLVYPDKIKPNKRVQVAIDEEINAYILANYSEIFNI